MKILILSHSSELSGAERSMIDLFACWDKKGLVEPHFIIRRPINNMAKELRKHGWNYTAIHYTNWSQRNPSPRAEDVYRNALFNTQAVLAIEKIIAELKPDMVMTNTIVSPWAALAAYFQKVPHVWFVREYGDVDHRHVFELGREKMLEDINTLSSLVVTNSKTLGKHIEDLVDKTKITALYTPFDIEALERKSLQRAFNPFQNPDSLKLVITGKIAPGKGQAEAAAAVARLIKKGYDTELCVIGKTLEPGDDGPLLKIIKEQGLEDKVHLVGQQSNPLAILRHADVGLMASKQEAFGRVTFEYMAIGLPVVGTASGATPEMIDEGQNGYLYRPNDINGLTEKLLNYAKKRELLKEHGAASRRKTQSMMSGAHNADKLYERLTSVLKDKNLKLPKPLNFSHRWLEYPLAAEEYIKEAHVTALHKLLYHRARHRAKWAYLTAARLPKFILRGGRRRRT